MTLTPLHPATAGRGVPDADTRHVAVALADGTTVRLRPLEAGELEPLEAVFDGLSDESRLGRYLVPLPRLTAGLRRGLTDVGTTDHAAWLATIDGRAAGIARYVRTAADTAEVAYEVVDAHQGRGLGTVLLDAITTVAAARGVDRVRATVLPTNAPSRALLARLDLPLRLIDGLLEGEAPLNLLDPPRVDRCAVLSVALAGAAGCGRWS